MKGDWVSAAAAWAIVWPEKKPVGGPNAIIRRAAIGAVNAKAQLLVKRGVAGETREFECDIPRLFWRGRAMIPNWQHGDFSARIEQNAQEESWEAIGVTFERAGILAMSTAAVSSNESPQSSGTPAKPKRGRPAHEHWETVMIELARQLYTAELVPKRLGDIEKAITSYFAARDVHYSESTIREHARPFWTMYSNEAAK